MAPMRQGAVPRGHEARRSVEVLRIQNAARNSTEWFENVDRYTRLDRAPLFVQPIEFGGDGPRLLGVLGGQQPHPEIGLADPATGGAVCEALDRACRKLQIFLAEVVNGAQPAPLRLRRGLLS